MFSDRIIYQYKKEYYGNWFAGIRLSILYIRLITKILKLNIESLFHVPSQFCLHVYNLQTVQDSHFEAREPLLQYVPTDSDEIDSAAQMYIV